MKELYIIISSQDYDNANHKMFWNELASISNKRVIIYDIPADYIVTPFLQNKYRLKESKNKYRRISPNLSVIRPLLFIRPEISPDFLFGFIARQFWKSIKIVEPDYLDYSINLIVYDARWVKILKNTHDNLRIAYYLFDEVRYNAHDDSINKNRYRFDYFACKNSNIIFTMTKKIAESRSKLNSNIIVLGNGAISDQSAKQPNIVFPRSIAFIGNFRNWIDKKLFTELIRLRSDILFVIAGPIQKDMKDYLNEILNQYSNTMYYGLSTKENMSALYKMFDGVIIPYKQNDFIQSTRPIKIVESVLAGVPVVTIPMDGYLENEFIRFAKTPEMFSKQIDYIFTHPIAFESVTYQQFVMENSWKRKCEIVDYEFSSLKK